MYMLKKEESVMMCLLYIKGEIRVCLMRRKMKKHLKKFGDVRI